MHGEVQVCERSHKLVFHYTARLFGCTVMEGWPGYRLARSGVRTTSLHHFAEGRLYGPFKLMQPLVHRMAWNERRRTVDALNRSPPRAV